MSRWNLRGLAILAAGTLFVAFAAPAPAAPPSGPGTTTDPRPPFDERSGAAAEFQSLGISRPVSTFEGVVLDIKERPLPNVLVKLIVDGNLVGTASTDGNGIYQLRAIYDLNADDTALLWFIAPDRNLIAKEVVLRESKASQEHHLISPCVPRTAYTPGRQFRIYLFGSANRNKELTELDCLR